MRRPLYWDLFTGAFGHTYGHHSVWQMWSPGRAPVNNPLMPWPEAIDQPGAAQMQHARALLESRPFLDARTRPGGHRRRVAYRPASPAPGVTRSWPRATRAGTYAMVYAPVGRTFSVKMDVITGPSVRAWWFNPRTGAAAAIGTFPNTGGRAFTPPDAGENVDWVLVLDDAAKGYPAPGAKAGRR